MGTIYPEPSRADIQNSALDALALIAASSKGDAVAVCQMLNTYAGNPAELAHLATALTGHGGRLLRMASRASGISVDDIVQTVAAQMRDGAV